MRLVVCAFAALWLAPAAIAGGVSVELAAVGSTLWSVSDAGLVAVDTRSGEVVARPLTPYAYPIRLSAFGGTLWVASVPNGFGSGAVTRIGAGRRRRATPLRLRRQGVFDVCAGPGVAWSVVGVRRRRVARIDLSGRVRFVGLGSNPAWCAADAAGGWFSTEDGRLVRVDAQTSAVRTFARVRGLGQVAAGYGFVWAVAPGVVVRVKESTGRATRIRFRGAVFSVAVGRRGAWILAGGETSTRLVLLETRTGRVRVARRLPGQIDSVLETPNALWAGGLDRGHRDTVLLRLDPRSLRVRRVVRLL